MALTGTRTYVGFGFGPIQGGLFLYEAYHSGNFGRLVVVEVFPEIVAAVRHADQKYRFNVAYEDRLEKIQVGPAQIE
ncbi:MAG: hypothetical protein GTO53_06375, partial [Planctomycetales bacterium]|nr:hypothetical protein [Planctomycetales bacterium]NIM08767.1 hypothetical protein [Planctomycetales bacterium]NIN08230.1 hypothetical protein [Planctomycetales bacterium]NIP04408.1 hypothetical protein [Planctomycetales bacterium]